MKKETNCLCTDPQQHISVLSISPLYAHSQVRNCTDFAVVFRKAQALVLHRPSGTPQAMSKDTQQGKNYVGLWQSQGARRGVKLGYLEGREPQCCEEQLAPPLHVGGTGGRGCSSPRAGNALPCLVALEPGARQQGSWWVRGSEKGYYRTVVECKVLFLVLAAFISRGRIPCLCFHRL